MGFDKSVTLVRFRMREKLPKDMDILEKLKQFCFRSIDDNPAESQSVGWVAREDMLDSDWRSGSPSYGEYMMFNLRVDTRKIPSVVVKKQLAEMIALEKKKTGKDFVPRERKKEFQEQIQLKLRSKIPPTPAVFEVVVKERENEVWFSSASSKIVDLFIEYFELSFGVQLDQLLPYDIALELFSDKQRAIDTLEVTSFASDGESALGIDMNFLLGRDFLTWLWYVSGSEFQVDGETCTVWEEKKLVLTSFSGETIAMSAGKNEAGNFGEIRSSISNTGKTATGMCLRMNMGEMSWSMNLKAETLIPNGFKIPKVDSKDNEDDPTAVMLDKMYFFEKGLKAYMEIFRTFLELRLNEREWEATVTKIVKWSMDK